MARPKRRSSIEGELRPQPPTARTKLDPRFNTALARGLEILMSFREGERSLSNVEIHERTGIPKATVSRLTFTLCEMGFLRIIEHTGQYELTPTVLALGYNVLSNVGLPALAQPLMAELARECGGTVGLAVRDGLHMIFLESVRGPAAPVQKVLPGSRFPLTQTALGWASVAALADDERDALMDRIRRDNMQAWPNTERLLKRAAKEVAKLGFCVGLGQMVTTINSTAAPFRHPDGQQIFVFSCYGSASSMTKEAIYETWGPRLLELIDHLRGRLS